MIGKAKGHLSCSIYEREILKIENKKNPPLVDLAEEKKHSEFVRELIEKSLINSCHDISDGGLLVALFEMSTTKLGCNIDLSEIKASGLEDEAEILFGEDQSRYVISINSELVKDFRKMAEKKNIFVTKVGNVEKDQILFNSSKVSTKELIKINELVFEKKFQ